MAALIVWMSKFKFRNTLIEWLSDLIDEMYEEKLSGESVHLDCKSKCEPSDEVQWFFNNRALRPDEKKLFQTVSNSLIIFNLTGSDNGTYTCKSHDVILKQHTIMVSGESLDVVVSSFSFICR